MTLNRCILVSLNPCRPNCREREHNLIIDYAWLKPWKVCTLGGGMLPTQWISITMPLRYGGSSAPRTSSRHVTPFANQIRQYNGTKMDILMFLCTSTGALTHVGSKLGLKAMGSRYWLEKKMVRNRMCVGTDCPQPSSVSIDHHRLSLHSCQTTSCTRTLASHTMGSPKASKVSEVGYIWISISSRTWWKGSTQSLWTPSLVFLNGVLALQGSRAA